MADELRRSMTELGKHADPPYFGSFEVTDTHHISVDASFGVLQHSSEARSRSLDVDIRVGDYKLDNTHSIRSRTDLGERGDTVTKRLPIDDDSYALRSALWLATDEAYKQSAESIQKVRAKTGVNAAAEDTSDDFSHEAATEYFELPATIAIDRPAWEARLRALSSEFRRYPELTATVSLTGTAKTRYYASSDGTRYQIATTHIRVNVSGRVTTDDGMELHRSESFDVVSPDRLPADDRIKAKIEQVANDLIALRKAPIVEPYLGPAILEGKAAAVFFHEVFGHRIEGHRQKDEQEGQTFAKKVGQPIMPDFISVFDDPSIATLNGIDVNGFYRYDDEGIPGARASLVENGVLKTFLLGRSPTRGFVKSNGHGRRDAGNSVVARQGNLVAVASRTVARAELTRQLLDEVKRQGKPYGYLFRELEGGFTITRRFEPQSFKLLSIMVYRVYPDGHEQLVRGADLEGTPLRALADIVAAADDVDTFNGYCGAESGLVPVSATSPSLLVAHVEVARKGDAHTKPPILPPPPPGGAR